MSARRYSSDPDAMAPPPSGDRPEHSDVSSRPHVRRRTRARELALQGLYLIDLRGPDTQGEVERFLEENADDDEVLAFARRLVDGCSRRREELDRLIAEVAENWKIHRMAVVDRNILRLGTYELLALPEVPPKVAINESIDLAKRYSTADSGAFVNGILDKLRSQLRPE